MSTVANDDERRFGRGSRDADDEFGEVDGLDDAEDAEGLDDVGGDSGLAGLEGEGAPSAAPSAGETSLAVAQRLAGGLTPVSRGGALASNAYRPVSADGLAIDPEQVAAEYEAVLAAKAQVAEGEDADGPGLADGEAPSGVDDAVSERIIASERVWSGSYLTVDAVGVELPDGNRAVHEVVRHPGAVAIIALDDQGRILLVRQYRTALERVTREIPAGKLEPGEDVEESARRELSEETGYTAQNLRYLIPVATAAGYSDEIIHLFLATGLTPGEQHPDADEFIVTEWADLREFINEVLDGKIEDSKTIIAAFICDAIGHRL